MDLGEDVRPVPVEAAGRADADRVNRTKLAVTRVAWNLQVPTVSTFFVVTFFDLGVSVTASTGVPIREPLSANPRPARATTPKRRPVVFFRCVAIWITFCE